MKSLSFIKSGILSATLVLFLAFNSNGQLIENPKASLELTIKQSNGTNGCAVTFDSKKQLYYTVFAGNSSYPVEVFNASGENVYQTDAGSDMRGLWFNPKNSSLEGNTYGDKGVVSMKLDSKGFPSIGTTTAYSDGTHQPNEQSCGAYNAKKKVLMYFDNGVIYFYKRAKKKEPKTLKLDIQNVNNGSVNSTSMIYTGVKKMEIGLLNYISKEVYLINQKTGDVTGVVKLPSNAVVHDMFRFSYANKRIFLFDTETRTWTGYQIFE